MAVCAWRDALVHAVERIVAEYGGVDSTVYQQTLEQIMDELEVTAGGWNQPRIAGWQASMPVVCIVGNDDMDWLARALARVLRCGIAHRYCKNPWPVAK